MKRTLMALAAMLLAASTFAQTTDSSYNAVADTTGRGGPDTLRVGNFIIVKQSKYRGLNNEQNTYDKHRRIVVLTNPHAYGYDSNYSKHTFTTNWLVFDLGFANINDKTDYEEANNSDYLRRISGAGEKPFTASDLKLRTKSSNVNIWAFVQRLNIAKNALNLNMV